MPPYHKKERETMQREYLIDIKTARRNARLTQEQAAEAVEVSLESWKAYESGQRIPPRETMAKICESLGADWLALEWLQASSEPLGVLPEGITVQGLATAALQLMAALNHLAEGNFIQRLVEIAADGVIEERERPAFREIVTATEDVERCSMQLKFTNDQLPPDKKRTAPTRARRRGRGPQHAAETDCKTIISHWPEKARGNIARMGGVSL